MEAHTEARAGSREQARVYRKAFETYVHHGDRAVLALGGAYVKALTAGTDSEGGHVVPIDWQAQILQAAGARAGLHQHVTAIPTSRDAVEWPTIEGADDIHASAVRRTWVDEQPAEGAANPEPIFGAIRIPVHTAMLTTKASRNLVEDSAVPFTDILAGLFADEVLLSDEESFLVGDGVGKPLGLLNTANIPTVKSGHASQITADGLLDLFYGLPAQYRDAAIFVTSSATEDSVRKLKDGNNQYLWVGGFAAAPETLLGHRVVSSEFMPATAAGATPSPFGDFGRYIVVDRIGFAVQRIDGDQQLAEKNQIGFVGRQRVGGRVTTARLPPPEHQRLTPTPIPPPSPPPRHGEGALQPRSAELSLRSPSPWLRRGEGARGRGRPKPSAPHPRPIPPPSPSFRRWAGGLTPEASPHRHRDGQKAAPMTINESLKYDDGQIDPDAYVPATVSSPWAPWPTSAKPPPSS